MPARERRPKFSWQRLPHRLRMSPAAAAGGRARNPIRPPPPQPGPAWQAARGSHATRRAHRAIYPGCSAWIERTPVRPHRSRPEKALASWRGWLDGAFTRYLPPGRGEKQVAAHTDANVNQHRAGKQIDHCDCDHRRYRRRAECNSPHGKTDHRPEPCGNNADSRGESRCDHPRERKSRATRLKRQQIEKIRKPGVRRCERARQLFQHAARGQGRLDADSATLRRRVHATG